MSSSFSLETVTSRIVKFTVLLILQIPSICCSLFLLYRWITKSFLRRSLHNQTVFVLVIVSLFQTISDLPMTLEYLRKGRTSSSTFCLLWNFFGLTNYAMSIWIMSWTCFERHLAIFHDDIFVTSYGKICFHYIPLALTVIMPWLYYFILIFFYPCKNHFSQLTLFCGWCCYVYNDRLVIFNWLTFGVIPTFLIIFLNVLLIFRVIIQSRRVRQQMNWYRHRRIIIQLFGFSSLYILFDTPTVAVGLIQFIYPRFAADFQMLYLFYLVYMLPLLVPLICASTFGERWRRPRKQQLYL